MKVLLPDGRTIEYIGGDRVFVSHPHVGSGADLTSLSGSISRAIVPLMERVIQLEHTNKLLIDELEVRRGNQKRRPTQNDLMFTVRQMQILQMLNNGMSPSQIATDLKIKKRTVDFHLQSIFKKTGCRRVLPLLAKLRAEGVL